MAKNEKRPKKQGQVAEATRKQFMLIYYSS